MNTDPTTMAWAKLALREAVRNHFIDPNVTLIEIGFKEHGRQVIEAELAIRIHVHQKLSEIALESAANTGLTRPIPDSISGFPTDVHQGVYQPQRWLSRRNSGLQQQPERDSVLDPMLGGIRISNTRHRAYGTLGGLVQDRESREHMLLSNWHVLVGDWYARPGQPIYQPGSLYSRNPVESVATLTRHAMAINLDAAVATLNGTRQLINNQFGLGPIRGIARPQLGMNVVKSGSKSSITHGQIVAIAGVAKIPYGSLERIIRDVVTIEPDQRFREVSAPGDSGSIWLDKTTMQAVGLHFAGSNMPERALALDIVPVLDALHVDLVYEDSGDFPTRTSSRPKT